MSFSLCFVAKSRASALAKLRADNHVPSAVKAVVESSINASPEGIVEVDARGHIGDVTYGSQSSQSATVNVRTIAIPD